MPIATCRNCRVCIQCRTRSKQLPLLEVTAVAGILIAGFKRPRLCSWATFTSSIAAPCMLDGCRYPKIIRFGNCEPVTCTQRYDDLWCVHLAVTDHHDSYVKAQQQLDDKGRLCILDNQNVSSHTLIICPDHKLLLPWNAGSGDDAFSLAPFPSTRLWLVCRRTIGTMLYPFVRGAAFKESLSSVFSYYNPYIAEYFRWLHWHSLAIFWLCPLILMHELYLFSNDFIYPGEQVDDYDNRVTIVLSMLLVLWSVLLSNKLHRPENGRIQQSHRLKWPPLTSFRSAVALGVTVVFLFIGYKANEARVVYVVYDCDHKGLEGSSARSLGLSFEPSNFRIYKCLIEATLNSAWGWNKYTAWCFEFLLHSCSWLGIGWFFNKCLSSVLQLVLGVNEKNEEYRNLRTLLQLVYRLVFEFAFNFVLFFKRQPYVMNELGWLIFNHTLLCKEHDDKDMHSQHLPVCLEYVRSRVYKEVFRIAIFQQSMEMLSFKIFRKYHFYNLKYLWRKWMARETIAPATVQIIQPPEYSDDDLSGDFREIVVQMIYISCYGVFGPNLVWIFWLNNLFEVCIDAAKVNTGLRSTAFHYEFYHHFWVINHHFHVWLCAVTHGAGSGTVNMVSTIHRYFAQFVLDDVRLRRRHGGAALITFKLETSIDAVQSWLNLLGVSCFHVNLRALPLYTQIFCFMATNAAVFAAVKLLRSKGYSEKEKVM